MSQALTPGQARKRARLRAQAITYLVGGFLTMIFMTLYLAPKATAQRRTEQAAQRVGLVAPHAPTSVTDVAAASASSEPVASAAPAAPDVTASAAPSTDPPPVAVAQADEPPPPPAASLPVPVVPAEPPAPDAAARPPLPATILVTRFSTGSAALGAGQLAQIERAAQLLRRNPELRAAVRGHADARGSDTENTPLSEERAAEVAAALRARGIEAARLQSLGSGSQNPLDEAATAAALARNRRVEIVFTWKDTP